MTHSQVIGLGDRFSGTSPMRWMFVCLFGLIALSLHSAIAIAEPQRIDEPDKYAGEIMALLSNNDMVSASKKISDTIGNPSYAQALQSTLSALTGKKIDYTEKVIDNTFGKSHRQIVYYFFVENIGFVYFRFNFKMSSSGWILANFNFKTETSELFPKDFIDREIAAVIAPCPPAASRRAGQSKRGREDWSGSSHRNQ